MRAIHPARLLIMALYLLFWPLLAVRIVSEETLLAAHLAGYDIYRRRVRYRLVPFMW
jgi:protein-S-isoprenylcysteine O-methyltransferase Ste14